MKFVFEIRMKPGHDASEYAAAWTRASEIIQRAKGAQGTRLHRKIGEPNVMLAIASWDTKAHRDAMEARQDPEVKEILASAAQGCEIRLLGEFEEPEWVVLPPSLAEPARVRDGGCNCGALRYRIRGDGLALTVCHCTDCQRTTGASFGMSLLLLKESLELLQGTIRTYLKTFPDDGREKYAKFCGDCGVRLWTEFSKFPQIVNLKPGTLDETAWLSPAAHIWLRSAQPWVPIPDGVLRYATQPSDYGPIIRAYAARMAAR